MIEFPTLAEVVAKHADFWIGGERPHRSCTCGWTDYGPHAQVSREQFAEHLSEMWREACTVTTVDQLDALPNQSIVLFPDGDPDSKWEGQWGWSRGTLEEILRVDAVLLLWHPEWSK